MFVVPEDEGVEVTDSFQPFVETVLPPSLLDDENDVDEESGR